jgi:hypothetical protein
VVKDILRLKEYTLISLISFLGHGVVCPHYHITDTTVVRRVNCSWLSCQVQGILAGEEVNELCILFPLWKGSFERISVKTNNDYNLKLGLYGSQIGHRIHQVSRNVRENYPKEKDDLC